MQFRWAALIAIWTIVSGPIFSTPMRSHSLPNAASLPASEQRDDEAAEKHSKHSPSRLREHATQK